jgi:hypothetical protein
MSAEQAAPSDLIARTEVPTRWPAIGARLSSVDLVTVAEALRRSVAALPTSPRVAERMVGAAIALEALSSQNSADSASNSG